MKHAFVSTVPSGANPGLVRPVNWNAVHVLDPTSLSQNTTLDNTLDWIEASGTITLILPPVASSEGVCYFMTNVGSGVISVVDANNNPVFSIGLTSQTFLVACDGTVWKILIQPGLILNFANAEVVTISQGSSTGTLAHTPSGVFSLFSRNGIIQKPGVDFTLSGTTVTLATPAEPGDQFLMWYSF